MHSEYRHVYFTVDGFDSFLVLDEPDVSKVLKKLEGKEEASVKEFYEVSDEIKKKLVSEKQQKEHRKWLLKLEEKADIRIESEFDGS